MYSIKKLLLLIFFPSHCLVCEELGAFLCLNCLSSIPVNEFDLCPICQKNETFLGKVCGYCQKKEKTYFLNGLLVSSFFKHPVLKRTIYYYKYNSLQSLSVPLSKILFNKIIKYPEITSLYTLVPVPLHPQKEALRGFNQSENLGKNLQRLLEKNNIKIKLATNLLLRKINIESQMKIKSTRERITNVKGCFKFNKNYLGVIPNNVILLDDIATTGATLNECAKTLKKAGVKTVWGLVLARQKMS